jgi:hypothetical protein
VRWLAWIREAHQRTAQAEEMHAQARQSGNHGRR